MQVFYTVRPGDTLFLIAQRWAIPLNSLIAANNLVSPYTIFPGQQLSVPPGINVMGVAPYYVVQTGDTLFGLAARYNVITDGVNRFDLIQQANNLSSTLIIPGMRLFIPYAPPGGSGSIAYVVFNGSEGDIRLYNPRSGQSISLVTGLATGNSTPYWSPDAKRIAFVGKNNTVYVVNVSNQKIAQIDSPVQDSFLAWSKDSSKLVYVKDGNIVIYDILTDKAQILNRPGATQAQLFPDGIHLLYVQQNQLIKERFVGVGMVTRIIQEQGPLHSVRLSPDGTFALYTTPGASISLIRTVQINSGAVYDIPGGPLAKNYFPEWAPDSLRLAYSATNFSGVYYSQIRVSGRFGENDQIMSISDCFATPVTWSPDGSKIAYLSGCRGGEFASELWVMDLRHPVPIQAISGLPITALKWSPV